MTESFDIVIIGYGPAGIAAAGGAVREGARVAVVESHAPGGACLHRGCIPYAVFIDKLRYGADAHGARASFDLPSVLGDIRRTQERMVEDLEREAVRLGIKMIRGRATIVSGGSVRVSTSDGAEREIGASRIVVAAGRGEAGTTEGYTQDGVRPVPGRVVHAERFFDEVTEIPPSAIVVGGGTSGIELAAALNSLGTRVTVFEAEPELFARAGRFASRRFTDMLEERGIAVRAGARVVSVGTGDDGTVTCEFDGAAGRETSDAAIAVVATGRRHDCRRLFASEELARNLGVRFDAGRIVVDEDGRSGCATIFAAGDATAGPCYAHRASADGRRVSAAIAGHPRGDGENRRRAQAGAAGRDVPHCVRTGTEFGFVGMSADDAQASGVPAVTGRAWAAANGYAVATGRTGGFAELVFALTDDRRPGALIGAQVLCPPASELIAACLLAMRAGADAETLAETVYAHPTFSELLGEAARNALTKTR